MADEMRITNEAQEANRLEALKEAVTREEKPPKPLSKKAQKINDLLEALVTPSISWMHNAYANFWQVRQNVDAHDIQNAEQGWRDQLSEYFSEQKIEIEIVYSSHRALAYPAQSFVLLRFRV